MGSNLFWIVPLSSIAALVLAWYFYHQMKKEDDRLYLSMQILTDYMDDQFSDYYFYRGKGFDERPFYNSFSL